VALPVVATLARARPRRAAPAAAAAEPAATIIASGARPDQTEVAMWFWDEISTKQVIEAYHKKQDKIRVKFTKLSYDDTHKKLLTSLAAGGGAPDICAIEIGYVGAFAGKGGLADLNQAPFDAGQFKNDMVAYKWTQGSTQDGRLVAMPWDVAPGGVWYRADLFQKAGLETDPEKVQARAKTWDDLFQIAEDLRKKTPNTALFADAFQDVFAVMNEQQGHGWFTAEGKLNYDKALKPLQRTVEARKRGVDAKIDWWGAEFANGIKQNAFAGMGIACWMQGGTTRDQPQTVGQWRIIHAPEGDYNMGGSFLSIPEQSKKKDAAWDFVKYICASTEGQNIIFKATGIFPAYKPAWKDPIYDQPVEFFGGQKAYRIWTDVTEKVPALSVNPNDRQAGDIIGAEVTKVKKEGKDPAKAIEDATAEAKKRIRSLKA
jgi:multiple sugar transport system substrate-binding protein